MNVNLNTKLKLKRGNKRTKAFFLATFMLLNMANITAQTWNCGATTSPIPTSAVTATLSGNTLTISGTGDMFDFMGSNVPWSGNNTNIHTVVINSGVTSVGTYAFGKPSYYNYPNISSVSIPSSVTKIGRYAFYYCTGLTSLTLANGLITIGSHAFMDCAALNALTIPNTVTTIDTSAFLRCAGIKTLTIPSSVTTIGEYAFGGCSSLKRLTIADGTTNLTIGYSMFGNCPIDTLYLGRPIPASYVSAFGTNVRHLTIGNNVTALSGGLFENCINLKKLIINDGTTTLTVSGNYVYSGHPFRGCSLDTVYMGRNVFNNPASQPFGTGVKHLTIGNSVTKIDSVAFNHCPDLAYLSIGNSVASIEALAFTGCDKLTSLSLPNSLVSIGWKAFSGCTGINSVTIPNAVTTIGEDAFFYCTNLTSITIPNNVTNIGGGAFSYCYKLATVNFNAINCTVMGNSNDPVFAGCTTLTTLNIGANGLVTTSRVKTIPEYAFKRCNNITSVTIPDSITSIGRNAFDSCTNLTTVNFNAIKCTTMGTFSDPVFPNCNSFITLNIGNSVKLIPERAFRNASNITTVNIGSNVDSILANAFADCVNVIKIYSECVNPPVVTHFNAFNNINKMYSVVIVPCGSKSNYDLAYGWNSFNYIRDTCTGVNITTTSLPNGAINVPYSQTLSASTLTTVTWSISGGSLPNGLSLNAASGLISGTPTAGGTFNFTVKASVAAGAGTKALFIIIDKGTGALVSAPTEQSKTHNSITINAVTPPANGQTVEYDISTTATPTGNWATNLTFGGLAANTTYYVFARSAENNSYFAGTAAYSVITTLVPSASCISLSTSGTHTFPSAAYNYGTQTPLTVTVANCGTVPTGALQIGLSGTNASSFVLSKTNISDIALSSSDNFTIVPNTGLGVGNYTAIITVSGTNSMSEQFSVSFTVNSANCISLSTSGTHTFPSAAYNYGTQMPLTVTVANCGTVPTGALQIGLSGTNASSFALSKTSISDIASGSDNFTIVPNTGLGVGNYTAIITVSGTNSMSEQFSVSFTVNKANGGAVNAPVLNTAMATSISIYAVTPSSTGQVVEYAINTNNSAPASGWQTGLSFTGLSLNTTYYIFARSKENNNYNTGAVSPSLVVATDGTLTAPSITTNSILPNGTVDKSYSQTLFASGDEPITWTVETPAITPLPDGLNLSANGVISGKPTKAGTFSFIVKASNDGGSDTKVFSIVVNHAVVGISDVETDNYPSVRVYPNPTTGELIIENGHAVSDIRLFDIVGKEISVGNRKSEYGNPTIEIDISSLANGLYYLKIDNRVVKVIKE